jgi:hypothetical protein
MKLIRVGAAWSNELDPRGSPLDNSVVGRIDLLEQTPDVPISGPLSLMRPGMEQLPWKSKRMSVIVPFANRIRFDQEDLGPEARSGEERNGKLSDEGLTG